MSYSRRSFLKSAAAVSLGFAGLNKLFAANDFFSHPLDSENIPQGYGRLIKDPNQIFDLPEGFKYKIISRQGNKMSDGFLVPGMADGMAAFPGENERVILIRNHEVNIQSEAHFGAFGYSNELLRKFDKKYFYDEGRKGIPALGGTTTIIYNTQMQRTEKEFLSLAGTLRNCAGGPTPWNSWLTCEETVHRADDFYKVDHGYVFEVPAAMNINLADPVPLKDMGRFNHEAVAVDPKSGIIYLTEDRDDGLFYRFIPSTPGKLIKGGRLQAFKVKGRKSFDTRNWEIQVIGVGETLTGEWIDLQNVQSPEDDLRFSGFANGAARFARGEGMWYGNNVIYFACTTGGRIQKGQIWSYKPAADEGSAGSSGELTLFVEPNNEAFIDHADNLTVAPWGDLIVCEDGPGAQYLVGVTPDGRIYKFGKNAVSNSELAGAAFSPDGTTLFFNIQITGLTLAVTGPWHKRKI